jgi:hypothetical protein
MLLVFAFTLFCSAMLLFLIEPMVGKMMMPLLGGTPAVWSTCMVFFQGILLAGYGFSHATTTWLGARRQARLQLAILFLPLLSFVVNAVLFTGLLSPNDQLIAGRENSPITALLLVLTLSVGLPMFVVCTSAPLLTRWFSSTDHPAAQDPYFLYGASNLGSMAMLIGYPLVIEPYLSLKGQQYVWVVGYGLLSACIAGCAVFMWKSRPAADRSLPALGLDTGGGGSTAIKPAEFGISATHKGQIAKAFAQKALAEEPERANKPVDWVRRLHWIALAAIPSSLMLGVTTYITTDIAAIPLLWVAPLTLYLLTFIIVFAKISPLHQSIFTTVASISIVCLMVFFVAPEYIKSESLLWLLRVGGVGVCALSFQILKVRDDRLIHRVMVMVMPLLTLLLLFMMLSEIKPGNTVNICLHLATMLIVSMVCHGELALDRPEPKYLTEFFLLMSVGGVIGGMFNGLLAPVVFNSHLEYPLMMMAACLLLPPLGVSRDNYWARVADIALCAVFVLVGGTLLFLRYRYEMSKDVESRWSDFEKIGESPWKLALLAIASALVFGGLAAWKNWGYRNAEDDDAKDEPTHWSDRVLDLALPVALALLVLGLYWGLPLEGITGRLKTFAGWFHIDTNQFRVILTFGLPAVLCYTFVERSLRFGLGVGAILLTAGFSAILADPPVHQERSFFGVLRVEDGPTSKGGYRFDANRLVHGTTLHGKQFTGEVREVFLDPEDRSRYVYGSKYFVPGVRDTPLSYYHRTGPVGDIFRHYNTDPKRAFAAIGLGTGTMASYGMPGQTVDFYDIDPVVVDISFDTNQYFHFVEDAEERGVDINLVLGDARLTFQPKGKKTRLKPLHRRKAETDTDGVITKIAERPARKFGEEIAEDFKYRLIVVDAFSSDAIPIHLITKQAVEIYLQRMEEDGILCMHISNRYLDLQPVLANIADELGLFGFHMSDDDNGAAGKNRSHWVCLTRDPKYVANIMKHPRWQADAQRLSLLGMASWPSAGPTLMTTAGLSFAFEAIAGVQAKMQADAEGLPWDDGRTRGDWMPLDYVTQSLDGEDWLKYSRSSQWIPLDQPSLLAETEANLAKDLEDARTQLAKIDPLLEQAKASIAERKTPADEAKKKADQARDDYKTQETSFGVFEPKDRVKLTAAQQAVLDRKKREMETLEKNLVAAQSLLDDASAPRTWYLKVKKRLEDRIDRYERHFTEAERKAMKAQKGSEPQPADYLRAWYEKKAIKARKVGVWTDDYSNLLSVLSW